MKIRERPDLHATIRENLKRRFMYYVNNPEKLRTAGGQQFLILLKTEYPEAYHKLTGSVGKEYTAF